MKTETTANGSTMLMTVFGVWSFFMLCRPQDYLPFLGYARPVFVLGAAVLCIWFLSANNREEVVPAGSQLKLYGYLILVMILSIPFSCYPRLSLAGLTGYGSVILFVFLFHRLMTSAEKVRKLLLVYSTGIAVYGLAILIKGSLVEGRIYFGTMFDPNDIAFCLISFVCFNLLFMSRENSGFVRLISLASLLLSLFIILKTGSRGGLTALVAVALFFLLGRSAAFKISFCTKGMLVVLAVFALQFTGFNTERYRTLLDLKDDYNITSETGRLSVWIRGMSMMAAHPLTGVGFDRFPEGMGREREARGLDSAQWQAAHNSLVQIGAETGVAGFLLYLTLSLNAYKIFAGAAREGGGSGLAKLGTLAQAGFIGHFVAAMFLSQAYSVYWAFYIALSAVLSRMRTKVQAASSFSGG